MKGRVSKLRRSLSKLPAKARVLTRGGGSATDLPGMDAPHPSVRADGPLSRRADLIAAAQTSASALEIGPFYNPSLVGPNVAYFDVLDRDALRARAVTEGASPDGVPQIDFVSPIGDLGVVDRHFAAAYSAHCVEHQPDLIRHLRQVGDLLDPGGRYYVVVPDRRYCFDHYMASATPGAVIEAHEIGRRVHGLGALIDSRSLTTHNDKTRNWDGDHGSLPSDAALVEASRKAMEEHRASAGGYIDIHAWRFTPASFARLMAVLSGLDLIPLRLEAVHDTPRLSHEFTAVFIRS
jgi:SAM-dependent methyltransferase